jgi:hypothetical protein
MSVARLQWRSLKTRFNKRHSNRLEPRIADCAMVSPAARGSRGTLPSGIDTKDKDQHA